MLIQKHVRQDSIIASRRLVVEFCNTISSTPDILRHRSERTLRADFVAEVGHEARFGAVAGF
jgi:hypothetical protein